MLQTNEICLDWLRKKIERSIKLGAYFMATGKYVAESKAFDDLRIVLVTEENHINFHWASEDIKLPKAKCS